MLASYVAAAFRRSRSDKLHTAINVVGLAIGLACFILIGMFVRYELGYDRQYAQSDRIYRISRDFYPTAGSTEAHLAANAGPVAPLLKEFFPQVEKSARIFCCGGVLKTPDGPALLHTGYAMADPELFEIFDFTWLRGDPATALAGPYDVVLTRSAARKHFGDADALGRTLLLVGGAGNAETLRVTGVIEDLPANTTLDFDMLESMAAWNREPDARRYLADWRNNVFHTYVLLAEGADIRDVQRRSGEFFERYFEQGSSASTGFTAMPISSIHLRSNRQGEMRGSGEAKIGNLATVYTFAAIAVLVLALACINFTNLATARAAHRAREIGVRKSVGASRGRLVVQFLAESVALALAALLVAVALVELVLPAYNAFLGRDLSLDYGRDPGVAAGLVLVAAVTGLAAGSYPAFYLSAFEPVRVLKGDITRGKSGAAFRRTLVVLQFSISIALLIATAVIHAQMRFVRGVDLGFDKEQIVVLRPNSAKGERWETLKREWLANPEVIAATQSDVLPFEPNGRTAEVRSDDGAAERMSFVAVDYGFFELYGIGLAAGRTFSASFGDRPANEDDPGALSDAPFIVNELAARRLGFTPEQAVGRHVTFRAVQGTRFKVNDASGTIVGVAKDVHYESLHEPVAPTIYRIPGGSYSVSLRISGRDVERTLAHIDERWRAFHPDLPVSRRFLAQTFTALYDTEERQQQMFSAFSALAMLVSCLGVLGLAAFATERRTKEIGVRKVLGGTIADIVLLFAGEFGRLVLLANVVAWPIALVFAREWLDRFAYRVELGLSPFVGGGLAAAAVTVLTVAAVAARAAAAKPGKSLRYE